MERTIVIAEAGVNHNGDMETAKKMVDVAKECGADYVKFQTADIDSLVIDNAPISSYQKNNIGLECSQKEMIGKILLPIEKFKELSEYCKIKDIGFLSTPFDIKSVYYLDKLVNIWKVPSGEITNTPYLIEIARTHKDVILSTGMSSLKEVEYAFQLLKNSGTNNIILLHCTTQYPAPLEDVNLNAMNTLKEHFNVKVGYSDHTKGFEISLAAVAMGASIIEKHFTLDKNMSGPDHKASLEPNELKQMIKAIRNINIAMGSGIKKLTESEKENLFIARKSIVAEKRIKKGEILTENNISIKRPGNGISPTRWFEILGKVAIRDFEKDEMIEI
jgi:N-acetylneuraminate synthase